jgi:hypothetical protein
MFNIILLLLIILLIIRINKYNSLCPNVISIKKTNISDSGKFVKSDDYMDECTRHIKMHIPKNVDINKLKQNRLKNLEKKIESLKI